ncbi:hypothetical protein [uncultured Actinomyces sp.]|uniref:hypothetical protein n=1 Tax=uncultured Actinomyces sp. TaxID=249061 RepID=UPI00260ACD01|nr:hypothetical protein [uncultured Actinomyces sp.]
MSNESRENLQGTEGQDVADLTAAAGQAVPEPAATGQTVKESATTGQAVPEPAAAAVDAAVEGATASSTNDTPAQQQQQQQPQQQAPQPTQGEVVIAPLPAHLPTTEPRPWYRSRRSFAAKGHGGKVLVAGLGLTYTDNATGAVLLADVDMGFRARTLSAILDTTGRRARALFLILAGLEEPHAGRIVAAPSRSWAARLAGRIGSVALIRTDTPLDNALTIRQNILAPLSATGSVADWDNLVGALQVTGLAQRVDLHPGELTAWERFKALIARAIVSGAEVFLIEDPVALPADARAELEPLLRSLANAGCAVVVSTPSVELAASTDRAILLTNGRVALDAPGPSQAIIAASLEANPEDPKALLGPIPAATPSPFDEVVAGSSAPAPTPGPAFGDPAADETALMAPISTDTAQASDQDRADAAERNIPTVDADDPALAEPEVSDLVVRARKILSDLPGSIAPKE